jgi:hypothetical protein
VRLHTLLTSALADSERPASCFTALLLVKESVAPSRCEAGWIQSLSECDGEEKNFHVNSHKCVCCDASIAKFVVKSLFFI